MKNNSSSLTSRLGKNWLAVGWLEDQLLKALKNEEKKYTLFLSIVKNILILLI